MPAASSSSSSAGPAPSADNCLRTLAHVRSLSELFLHLPNFQINAQWEVRRAPFAASDRIGKVRCIQGQSLRVDCDLHKPKDAPEEAKASMGKNARCKLHIMISGRFEEAQCVLARWCAFGTTCGHAAHWEASRDCAREWREACAGA